jgi:hypothetical protein
MRMLSEKRAISEVVSYVLLVSLSIAMAGIIYAWLNFYVKSPLPEESCPDVSLIILEYKCDSTTGFLNLTVQNRGRFDVDGYYLKINNGQRDVNLYLNGSTLSYVPLKMMSGQTSSGLFDFNLYDRIKNIEIEPIKGFDESGRTILCKDSIIRQDASNCVVAGRSPEYAP